MSTYARIAHDQQVSDLTALIKGTADLLGIQGVVVEQSQLLRDTLRVQLDDCTGRKQTLFLPLTGSPARVSQTLRFLSGPREAP